MKNKIIYTVIGILCVLVVGLGVTLAYWMANVEGTGETITLELADLKVILNDPTIVTETGIEPGWSTSKTFTVENQGNGLTTYNIIIKNLVNTLVSEDYLQYKITSSNGYNMEEFASVPKGTSTEAVLAYSVPIEGKVTHSYTIELRYIESNTDQSEDMGKVFSGNLSITEGTDDPNNTLYKQLLADKTTILTRDSFNAILTTENTKTLYSVNGNFTEDGSTVYYFAGNTTDNWVKFGKDQNGSDLYWRIIRTNEDGSVRLLYVGTDMATTSAFPVLDGTSLAGGSDTTGMYNSTYNNSMYVGYMYGTTGSLANNRTNTTSSPIKTVLDSWYSKTMSVQTDGTYTYDNYVSKTAIYCNDRSTPSYSATAQMYYAAYYRLTASNSSYANTGTNQPSYKCGNNVSGTLYETTQAVEDKFSVSTASGGNGQLTYGVALMTADEVAFAGGLWLTNSQAWYYYNSAAGSAVGSDYWWTMSPYSYSGSSANVFVVLGSTNPGHLNYYNVNYTLPGARPTVSLKSCTSWVTGDGSTASPYEVKVTATCAAKEN